MTQEKRWKVQELSTNGWTSIDPQSANLTKEECDRWLNVYMDDGIAPDRLRAVPSLHPDDGLESLDQNKV
jgi:hypothetical protein